MNTVIVESLGGKNKTHKDLSWVLKARSKDPTRENLNGVLVTNYFGKDIVMVATDGHRLHHAELTSDGTPLPEGFYEPLKIGKDQIILQQVEEEFPDYKQAIPEGEPERTRDLLCEMPHKGKTNHSRIFTQAARMLNENYCLDYNLFCEAVDGETDWTFEIYADESPAILKNCNKTAAIMPMKIKD